VRAGLDRRPGDPGAEQVEVVVDLERAEAELADVDRSDVVGAAALSTAQAADGRRRGEVEAGVWSTEVTAVEASLLIFPGSAVRLRDGVSTCRVGLEGAALRAPRTSVSRWLPGLRRAVPSAPLDERYAVVVCEC
jgi:hypothetical protein